MPTAPFPVPSAWSWRPSPNHNGRGAARVSAIVLHADAAGQVASSLNHIRRAESGVSYHVMIGRTGEVYICVSPDRRAWHAGVSSLEGVADCNTYSIGVCLSNRNDGIEPYPAAQVAAAADVCALLCRHYGIGVWRIVTHAAVALPPGRKTDPAHFDLPAFHAMVADRLLPRVA